jgi:hypothetical protein
MPEALSYPRGEALIVQPGEEEGHWQPLPANGRSSIMIAPDKVKMQFPFGLGTQMLPPGGYVREHAHVSQEEAFFFVGGKGKAVVDGAPLSARDDHFPRHPRLAHVRE